MTFDAKNESLDIKWLQENGWTIAANLAYRHVLNEHIAARKEGKILSRERIEEIIMQYDAEDQVDKIFEALEDLANLVEALNR